MYIRFAFVMILAVGLWGNTPLAQNTADNANTIIVEAEESLIWQRREQRYIAQGNAKIEYGSLVLTADRIEAKYADDGDNGDGGAGNLSGGVTTITHIHASGSVMLIDTAETEREMRSDALTYDVAGNIATLTGSVVIIDGSNRITGDTAEINLESGASTVQADDDRGGRVTGVFLTPEN